jgi:uncharacterized protein
MAHESFEDKEVADLLNERFVSIKVDREERPDIDSVYMNVCQALTGHGGWPLSVFLTPDQKPFYAGTYFPKTSRYGQPGFMDVLHSLSSQYQEDPERILNAGEQIVSALNKAGEESEAIHADTLSKTYEHFKSTFDPEFGGFGQEPKFPSPHQLMFLLRYARLHNEPQAIRMAEKTLEAMAQGGIRDHLGGGFARYSVDREWLVPHFEKMLYDQAMLMMAYSEAYQVTKKPEYESIVADIYRYVSRELTDPEGGFYSAEDADSEGVEGKFYVWHPDEVLDALGEDEGTLFCNVYDITNQGNFEGTNIPHLIKVNLGDIAKEYELSAEELEDKLASSREKLFQHRENRIHPHKDDKVLTSWNGMMIAALAAAYQAFQNKDYLHAAERAFDFLEKNLRVEGKWMARYREGEVKYSGYLDDYAFMLWAADSLYEATFDASYLTKMKTWTGEMTERFWDRESFGFYLSDEKSELFVRPKDVYDGAIPSGNSVAALMLLKLARRTGDLDYEMFVDKMFNRFGAEVNRYPMGHTFFLSVYLLAKTGTKELVVLTKSESEFDQKKDWQTRFHPEVITLVGDQNSLAKVASFTKDFLLLDEQTTFYLCEHFVCQRPTTDWEQIEQSLK